MRRIVLFTAIILLKLDKTHSLDNIEALDKSCPIDGQCATKDSCSFWKEKGDQLKQLPRGSPERNRLLEEFKSAICNKEKKGLCCPLDSKKLTAELPKLDLVEASDKSCSSDSQCATRDSCGYWSSKSEELGRLQQGSQQYKSLRNELVSAICNKKRKGLCCPQLIATSYQLPIKPLIINDSPTYLPVTGECGLNPEKSPSKVSILYFSFANYCHTLSF